MTVGYTTSWGVTGAAASRVEIAMIKWWGAKVLYEVIAVRSRSTVRSASPVTCPSSGCTEMPARPGFSTGPTRSTR